MVIVVGAVLGPLAVVVFSTLRTLTRLVFQLILVVSRATEPELASAYGTGNRSLMNSLFVHALRAGIWLGLVAVIMLAIFGREILDTWTHGKVTLEPVLYASLLGSAFASVLWQTPLFVLRAANAHVRAAPVYLATSASAVVVAWAAMKATGAIWTAGFSLLAMDALVAFYAMLAAGQLLRINVAHALIQALNFVGILALLRRYF